MGPAATPCERTPSACSKHINLGCETWYSEVCVVLHHSSWCKTWINFWWQAQLLGPNTRLHTVGAASVCQGMIATDIQRHQACVPAALSYVCMQPEPRCTSMLGSGHSLAGQLSPRGCHCVRHAVVAALSAIVAFTKLAMPFTELAIRQLESSTQLTTGAASGASATNSAMMSQSMSQSDRSLCLGLPLLILRPPGELISCQ
jgi:hypothetical protein